MYVFDLAVDNHFFELQKRAHPRKVVGAKSTQWNPSVFSV